MKRFYKTFAVVAALACIGTANAQELLLHSVMKEQKLTTTEAAAAILIGEALGVKMDWLMHAQAHHSETFVILGPAIIISRHTGHDLDYIMKNKPKGKGQGWGNIAKQMGMHPGQFNKMRVKGGTFESMLWMNMLNKKYKYKSNDYQRLLKDGFKDAEIVLAVVRTEGKPAAMKSTMAKMKANRPTVAGTGSSGPGKSGGKGKGKGKGGGR